MASYVSFFGEFFVIFPSVTDFLFKTLQILTFFFPAAKQCKQHLAETPANKLLYHYVSERNCIITSFVTRVSSVIFIRRALEFNYDPRLLCTFMICHAYFLQGGYKVTAL